MKNPSSFIVGMESNGKDREKKLRVPSIY